MTAPSAVARATGAGCPAEARLIRALHRALFLALVPKRDGSRHDRNCREARVNSVRYPCSDVCAFATGALLLAQDWESEHADEAPRQLRLEAS